jgi:broad specificity phosphatase PhoE
MAATGWPEQLWVVRHAESVGNAARIAAQEAGEETIAVTVRDPDVPISERGTGQAEALGRWLAREHGDPPSAILASPYQRTRETAVTIADAAGWPLFGALETGAPVKGRPEPSQAPGQHPPIPVIFDERLREKDPGRLEGLTRAGIIKRYPLEAEAYGLLGKFYYRPPGGESWCDVILRLRSLVDALRAEYAGGRVLIVTHQVVVSCLRYVLEGLDEAGVLDLERPGEIANSSFTSYRREGDRLVLAGFNEVAHLADEGVAVTAEPPVTQPLDHRHRRRRAATGRQP